MIWRPSPCDGSGLIGDVRYFTVDGVEWRAFEFVSPVSPRDSFLVLVDRATHYTVSPIPPDWRWSDGEDLLERLGIGCASGPKRFLWRRQ